VLQSLFFFLGFFFFLGWWFGMLGGLGIRKNQNIFRKISTNNSENNYKLSYTPKPLCSPPESGRQEIIQNSPGKTRTHPPEKINKQKKVDS